VAAGLQWHSSWRGAAGAIGSLMASTIELSKSEEYASLSKVFNAVYYYRF